MLNEPTFMDSIMNKILDVIMTVLKFLIDVIFINRAVTLIFWFIFMNLIAIFLMKKDKSFAKESKRRIRESTLIMVALAGGGIGMYYAMYKYKHKTLHKKFTILVPLAILFHFALISYLIAFSIMF